MLRLHRRALHREPLLRRGHRLHRAQGRRAPAPRLRPRAAAVVGRGQICRAVPALLPGEPVLSSGTVDLGRVAHYLPLMPRAAARPESKFARYRQNKRRQGMKLLRIWVPDPNAPGFAEEVKRQAALLRDAPEQEEVLDFIEAAASETWPE